MASVQRGPPAFAVRCSLCDWRDCTMFRLNCLAGKNRAARRLTMTSRHFWAKRLMNKLEREMIHWGKLLFKRRIISGWGGNLSCRTGKNAFLITGQHAPLGFLMPKDLVRINQDGRPMKKERKPSSETPMHMAV